jgi:hypothetical protein
MSDRSATTKVTYRVMTRYNQGVMSERVPPTARDDGEPYDLGELGPHPFSCGYPDAESASGDLARAQAFVTSEGGGEAWIELVTETTTTERLPS